MPIFLLAYVVVESLAFFLVAKLIGVGWALLAAILLMILGGAISTNELRKALFDAADGRTSVGQLAGDSALLIAGWALSVVPGFVTSLLGLPLVFAPTRAIVRRTMTSRVRARVEDLGAGVYAATPLGQQTTSYGSFADPARPAGGAGSTSAERHEVIDAEELEQWYRMDGGGER